MQMSFFVDLSAPARQCLRNLRPSNVWEYNILLPERVLVTSVKLRDNELIRTVVERRGDATMKMLAVERVSQSRYDKRWQQCVC